MIRLKDQLQWIGRLQWTLAAGTFCGLGLFYFAVYRPITNRESELRSQTVAIEMQLRKNEETARDLNAVKQDVARLRDQITRSRQLPEFLDLPKFLRDITQLSQSSNLQRFRYEPDAQRRQELCTELPIVINFDGKFPDVASFLRQAEEMPRMTRTRRLQLRSKDSKTGAVEAQMMMSIYFAEAQ